MMTKKKQKKKKKKKKKRAISINRCVWLGVVGGWERRRRSHLNIMAGVWVARERLANAMARKSLPLFPFSLFLSFSILVFFLRLLSTYIYIYLLVKEHHTNIYIFILNRRTANRKERETHGLTFESSSKGGGTHNHL